MLRGRGSGLIAAVLTLATASLALGQGMPPRDNARVLAFGGEARIQETDAVFLTRPADIALAANGRVYVSETDEGRVLEIATTGQITRIFGRKGRGPGELAHATSIGLAGDSLLLVWDQGERRLTTYSLRTGDFVRSFSLGVHWIPAIRVAGSEILLTTFDQASATSVLRVSALGDTLGREGPLPALIVKHPVLAQGWLHSTALGDSGADVFAAFDLSPALYRWPRGSTTAVEFALPAVRRRGVKLENFEQMLRDPANAAQNQRLLYDRSIPMELELVAPSVVGLVTVDLDWQWEKQARSPTYFLSLLDVQRHRACVDVPVPASREFRSIRDGMPFVALSGNTLVILQQDVDAAGGSLATLRRFRIDPSQCAWVAVPSPGR